MPIGIAAGVGALASVASGIIGANASKKSASQIAGQIGQGINFQQGAYNTAAGNLQPYIGAGQSALPYLLAAYGLPGGNAGGLIGAYNNFQQTPTYQFPLQRGNLALNRQLAATGLIGSGGALRDAIQYNQGYAGQQWQNYLNGILGIASGGVSAAGTLGQIGTNIGANITNAYTNQGGAIGAGTVGAANAYGNAFGGIAGAGVYGAQNGLFSPNGSLAGLFGGGASSYTGPSGSALIGGAGTPDYLQGQLGLPSNQYVP